MTLVTLRPAPATCQLLGRLAFAGLVLGAVFAFDRGPVALMPGTIGGRIALRADQDPPRPASGCPGGLAFVAGIAFRCGGFRGRLAPGTALAVGTVLTGGFEMGSSVGFSSAGRPGSIPVNARPFTTCEPLLNEWLGENNTWFNSSRQSRRLPRGGTRRNSRLLPPSPARFRYLRNCRISAS